jgi:hypothetical protein
MTCKGGTDPLEQQEEKGVKSSFDSGRWKLYILVPKFDLCQLSLNASGMAAGKTYRPYDNDEVNVAK